MAKPIATQGSMHVCPMYDGTKPHVGGPIIQGEATILINGKPAATQGSTCACQGPVDMVVQGSANVFFNGKPVACLGDMSAHGGTITEGEANVTISDTTPSPSVTMPVKKIPFPKIRYSNMFLGNAREAIINQEKIKELAEKNDGEPRIYNLQWIKEREIVRKSATITQVILRADVINFNDGETVKFTISIPSEKKNKPPKEISLSGKVKDKQVEVVWETESKSLNES